MERYERNLGSIDEQGQKKIHASHALVIGCGGLGGFILEGLARLGVKTISLVDFDTFQSSNLNRQLFATPDVLSCPKVKIAAKRIHTIDPSIDILSYQTSFTLANAKEIMQGVTIVFDAVDNLTSRLAIEHACMLYQVPLIHGAVAGWYGQVATILPGKPLLTTIYHKQLDGVEQRVGNPYFIVSSIASLQLSEGVKIICGIEVETNGLYTLDLLRNQLDYIPIYIKKDCLDGG